MTERDAGRSGTFTLGGDLAVTRLGFGAMRITGAGIWGPPADPEAARATLRRAVELGIDFIDTADSYGPFVSEDLIAETLRPYRGLVVATKGGLVRHGPNVWKPVGRPEYLRQCVLMSLRRLGLERIDLWQLHKVDPLVPEAEQFGAIADMQREGLIRHVGLSNARVETIRAAQAHFPVASVQNRYNLADRAGEDVLEFCTREGIGFIPWAPLAAGRLAREGSALTAIARDRGVSTGQVALAWLLRRSPVMLPIPGTGSPSHLEENVAAADLSLSDEEAAALQAAA